MKKQLLHFFLVGIALSGTSFGANVVNGPSGYGKIISIESRWSATVYYLDNQTGCGQDNGWVFDFPGTDGQLDQRKAKIAMLLAAYATNRTVYLTCENSKLTGFTVND